MLQCLAFLWTRPLPTSNPAYGDLEAAFSTLSQQRVGAVMFGDSSFYSSRMEQLAALTARHALPAIYAYREFALAGGLMSYGTDVADMYRQVGVYSGNILKMLWGGSGEHISIAALTNAMEPRHDETQNQDCERFQPMSRSAGYGREIGRGDRDESIELACCRLVGHRF